MLSAVRARRRRAVAGVLGALLLGSTVAAVAPATAVVGDPAVAVTAPGTTSVTPTQGKARGSGLWGFAGDVRTQTGQSNVFSYGLAFSPTDGSLWVTDSAKIVYGTLASPLFCGFQGGTVIGSTCYVGDSRVLRYEQTGTDWSLGQYQADGLYGAVPAGANAGVGGNYAPRAAATVITGVGTPSGEFGGARGVAVTDDGTAWVTDPDAVYSGVTNSDRMVRLFEPDGTESGALGLTTFPAGGNAWANRHHPESFDYNVGVTRLGNGDMLVTSQTPELLKQYRADGTFVRNVYLHQAAGTAYAGDGGYRSPYAVAADPTTPANDVLVGYIDPGTGNASFIERIDLDSCTTQPAANPAGSSRDVCAVTDVIGVGTLATGNGNSGTSSAVTFAIAVDPTTADVYVAQRTGRVSVFASDGTPKGAFPAFGAGTANGQVQTVRGIAFDARGFLYLTVSEGTTATRVQIFARTPDPVAGLTGSYTSTARTEATLTWAALPDGVTPDAQAPLRDYVVEQSTDGGTTWTVVPTPVATTAGATVTGLDPALSYTFRVSAWNEAGNGDWAVTPLAAAEPSTLTVVKTGNGVETATDADAVQVPAGSDVVFSYTVTNDGPSDVTGLTLSDSVLGTVTTVAPADFDGSLADGESVTFTASGPVAAGAYQNTATATGTSAGETVTGTDVWYGFGTTTGLTVVKTGNGVVAETVDDAVTVAAGADVVFGYTVTNTGNVPVTALVLTDSVLGDVTTVVSPTGFDGTLAPGATVTYSATGPVAAGAYTNRAFATGVSAGASLTASDDWYGFGVTTALSVVKTGGGVAVDSAEQAHHVPAGTSVPFTYTVTNGGNTPVTLGDVVDSVLGVVAPPAGFDGVLDPTESVVLEASGPIAAGAYRNDVTVTATSPQGEVEASDSWFGFGVTGGLSVVKTGDGVEVAPTDEPHMVAADTTVDFTYTVTNTGNAPVTLVSVVDDRIGAATAPADFDGVLDPTESVVLVASGPVAAGPYTNEVLVSALDAAGGALTADDDWSGFGVTTGLSVVKAGDGVRAPQADAPHHVPADSTVTFAYTVTNTGNTSVELLSLVDDVLGLVAGPAGFDGTLEPDATVTFTTSGPVAAGVYRNQVDVAASTVLGAELTAQDVWHGFGDMPQHPTDPMPPTDPSTPPTDPTSSNPAGPTTPRPSSVTSRDGELERTGVDLPVALGATALLLGAGGAVLLVRRRREGEHTA